MVETIYGLGMLPIVLRSKETPVGSLCGECSSLSPPSYTIRLSLYTIYLLTCASLHCTYIIHHTPYTIHHTSYTIHHSF
ncbi:hypothetical protein EON63_14785 [archaeon]|nr:MAG: hypothetical protein EON63_14785 [archaeon]